MTSPAERLRVHATEARVKVKIANVDIPAFVLAEITRCADIIDGAADRVATLEAALRDLSAHALRVALLLPANGNDWQARQRLEMSIQEAEDALKPAP